MQYIHNTYQTTCVANNVKSNNNNDYDDYDDAVFYASYRCICIYFCTI